MNPHVLDRNIIKCYYMTNRYGKYSIIAIAAESWNKIQKRLNPNLGGGRGGGNFTPCWFSHNNSETVKVATLAVCSI